MTDGPDGAEGGGGMGDSYSLGEVVRAVRRIEDKLDAQVRDHEGRIRSLEQWMWRLVGVASVGGASSIAAWISILTKGKA